MLEFTKSPKKRTQADELIELFEQSLKDHTKLDLVTLVKVQLAFAGIKEDIDVMVDRLHENFGGVESALFADFSDLIVIPGMTLRTAVFMMLPHSIMKCKFYGHKFYGRRCDSVEESLVYCMERSPKENIWLAGFNEKREMVALFNMADGTAEECHAFVDRVLRYSAMRHAHYIAVAHNHPHAKKPQLSANDRDMMGYLREALKEYNLKLVGQLVMARSGHQYFNLESDGE